MIFTLTKTRMKRVPIRVEPFSTYLAARKVPATPVMRAGDLIFVCGLPPFDPETGEVKRQPIERQMEIATRGSTPRAASGAQVRS